MLSGPSRDEYPASISSFTPSSSQPSTEPSPALTSLLSLSTSTSVSTRDGSARRSLSLLGKLPKDFTSLIRSHSLSARRSATLEETAQPSVHFSDYDEIESVKVQRSDMFHTQDEDRQARKAKKGENRFYHFLTRSRSRSRSKQPAPSTEFATGLPELGHDLGGTHSTESSLSKIPSLSKRTQLVESRPLSSSTNTTVSPPTPKPRSKIPTVIPKATPLPIPQEPITSRPSTPKSSITRRKLNNLFGLPLSRKASMSSPPGSPEPRLAPALDISSPPRTPERKPLIPQDPNGPKLWTARVPTPNRTPNRTPTRTPRSGSSVSLPAEPLPEPQECDLSASVSTHDSSAPSHHRSSSKTLAGNGLRVSHPRPRTSTAIPSSSMSRSTSNSETDISASQSSHGPTIQRQSSSSAMHSSQIPTPRSQITTLASRPRASSLTQDLSAVTGTSTQTSRMAPRKDSIDSSHRYRPMTIVDEERGSGDFAAALPETHRTAFKPEPKTRTSTGIRSTKHGSFDFERPGWGSSVVRSPSGTSGTTAVGSSHGLERSRDSLNQRGDRTLQKSSSLRESPANSSVSENRQRRLNGSAVAGPSSSNGQEASGSTSHSHKRSVSSGATPVPIQSSSLGRSSGKRTFGSGLARLVGMTHGPFAFERPGASPTTSNFSVSTKANGKSPATVRVPEREKDVRQRERQERHEEKEKERERRREARRTAQFEPSIHEPKPTPSANDTLGYRSAHKGRSLDLGLGLAWAPRSIKEDALLPSTFTFDKSQSASSKRNLNRRHGSLGTEVNRSEVGRDVAEMFKNALDSEGYATFRKYVHRFDAHEIPFDGSNGILSLTENLLDNSSRMTKSEK